MWRGLAAHGNGAPTAFDTPDALRAALADGKSIVWIDFADATPDEVELLADTFGLDPLTVEDCVSDLHHPKIDDFEKYLYLVVHGVLAGRRRGEMKTIELDVVIQKNALVTFRHDQMRSVDEAWQKATSRAGFLAHGPVQVLQTILSTQADHYIEEVERIGEEIQALEADVFADRQPIGFERQVFSVKHDIAHLRQVLGTQRELVHRIGRGDFPEIPERTCMVFRDVYDHLYRATEMLDTQRDLSMALLETHLAIVANPHQLRDARAHDRGHVHPAALARDRVVRHELPLAGRPRLQASRAARARGIRRDRDRDGAVPAPARVAVR
jgi:magnesium transporter